jgi:hypothetical protein
MSLPSTSTLRTQLNNNLGDKAPAYWRVLKTFLGGHISRDEFDEEARRSLDTPRLVQLHNALVISLFDTSVRIEKRAADDGPGGVKRADSMAGSAVDGEIEKRKGPPKKRRRMVPYQGEGPDRDVVSLRSSRFKRWAVGAGRKERARLRGLGSFDNPTARRLPQDEILQERGVQLLPERGGPCIVLFYYPMQMLTRIVQNRPAADCLCISRP